jgi:hypothetical protein
LAPLKLAIRLDRWPPVLIALIPLFSARNTTRWNSGRGSNLIESCTYTEAYQDPTSGNRIRPTCTRIRGNWHRACAHPPSLLSAGTTNRWNVTSAEAGFPGSAKIGIVWFPAAFGIVANVVGFPGFIFTRPKCMVPLKFLSITGLSKSEGPIEVPPVVIRMSAASMPCWMLVTWELTLRE